MFVALSGAPDKSLEPNVVALDPPSHPASSFGWAYVSKSKRSDGIAWRARWSVDTVGIQWKERERYLPYPPEGGFGSG